MHNSLKIVVFASALSFVGCDDLNQSEKNTQAIKEAIKSREIKKVSDADILTKGEQLGSSLGRDATKPLMMNFAGIKENQTLDTLQRLAAAWSDSISLVKPEQIVFVSSKEKEGISNLEIQLIEAYEYNLEHNLPAKGAVQFVNGKERVLFTYPLVINKDTCPSCLQEDGSKLLGMWSIEFTVKEIVAEL